MQVRVRALLGADYSGCNKHSVVLIPLVTKITVAEQARSGYIYSALDITHPPGPSPTIPHHRCQFPSSHLAQASQALFY